MDAGDDGVEQAATVWEFVTPVAEVADWAEVGAMVRRLHGLDPAHVPAGYPVAACTSFPWWHFDARLAEVEPLIDAAAHDGLAACSRRAR